MMGLGLLNKAIRIEHPSGSLEDLVMHYTMDNASDGIQVDLDEDEELILAVSISQASYETEQIALTLSMGDSIYEYETVALTLSIDTVTVI